MERRGKAPPMPMTVGGAGPGREPAVPSQSPREEGPLRVFQGRRQTRGCDQGARCLRPLITSAGMALARSQGRRRSGTTGLRMAPACAMDGIPDIKSVGRDAPPCGFSGGAVRDDGAFFHGRSSPVGRARRSRATEGKPCGASRGTAVSVRAGRGRWPWMAHSQRWSHGPADQGEAGPRHLGAQVEGQRSGDPERVTPSASKTHWSPETVQVQGDEPQERPPERATPATSLGAGAD